MEWDEIMEIADPNEALRKITIKVDEENLPVEEMENAFERYTKLHGITSYEMSYYPNGEHVLKTHEFW